MARQADFLCLPPFQQAFPALGLTFAHQFCAHFMTVKATLALQNLMHPDHGRILAVADRAFKSVTACPGYEQCYKHEC